VVETPTVPLSFHRQLARGLDAQSAVSFEKTPCCRTGVKFEPIGIATNHRKCHHACGFTMISPIFFKWGGGPSAVHSFKLGPPMTSSLFRLVFQPSEELRATVFEREAQIFDATYGVPYDEHVLEFAPYESASVFLAVLDSQDDVAGVMRLILPGPAGLKTLNEAAGQPWCIDAMRAARAVGVDPERTWDVATLGVTKGIGRYRFAVTAALYHGLSVAARRNDVRSLLMTVDDRVRSILQVAGLFTTALPGAKSAPFCGSPASTPVYGHCADMFDTQRRVNPDGYRLIVQGVGLDEVSIPPLDQFDIARPATPTSHPHVEPAVGPGLAVVYRLGTSPRIAASG